MGGIPIDDGTTAKTPPTSFVIWMQADDARAFGGKRKFAEYERPQAEIAALEEEVGGKAKNVDDPQRDTKPE